MPLFDGPDLIARSFEKSRKYIGGTVKRRLEATTDAVVKATRESGLPGWLDGPADAYRHALLAAELTRVHGTVKAQAILALNEVNGMVDGIRTPLETARSTIMDTQVNLRAGRLGEDAKSFEEVERRVAAEIARSIEANGSGANKTFPYLSRDKWKNEAGDPESNEIPPDWVRKNRGERQGNLSPGPASRRIAIAEALDKPDADWTEEDARAVMDDPRYYAWSHADKEALHARVRRYYARAYPNAAGAKSAGGGPVRVDSYVRGDGTPVTAHSRAAPSR